jgi:hypothetical protein
VAQRQVGGLAAFDGEGDADQPRLQRIEVGGLGVERDQRRGIEARQPVLQGGFVEDALVAAAVGLDAGWRFESRRWRATATFCLAAGAGASPLSSRSQPLNSSRA